MSQFDILIAGGGLIGSTAALALSRQGFSVALIEAQASVEPTTEKYDLRVSAISPGSQEFLDSLNLWAALPAERVCYYEQMRIWHDAGEAEVAFDAGALGKNQLGAIVENGQLLHVLNQASESESRLAIYRPSRVAEILHNDSTKVSIRLDSGEQLTSNLLLVAEGRNSSTRELAGISAQPRSYHQRAIVANVDTEKPHQFTAWQRFLHTGPLAFLPLANGDCSIVWSCDDPLAQRLMDSPDTEFCRELSMAYQEKLGQVVSTSARASFPLMTHWCEQWIKDSVVLLGDSAHSVHPLAGQGVNLGFSDVQMLSEMLRETSNLQDLSSLRRYERERKSDTWLASKGFSLLKAFYGNSNPVVTGVRDLGMRLVNQNALLKRSMISKAIDNMI